jgi:hypothetical protein
MSKYPEDSGYQTFRILQVAFVVVPLLAGLDKFFYLLTNWSQYIAPIVWPYLQGQGRIFMMIVGIIEIIAAIGIIWKPQVFGYIVFIWLLLIVINLILTGGYFDIALRDLGLSLSALALARASHRYARNA